MTRLGYCSTILTLALAPVVTGSAFAQTDDFPQVHVDVPRVDVPRVVVPRIDVPRVVVPQIDTPWVEIPRIEIPRIEIPRIEIPGIDMPPIDIFPGSSLSGVLDQIERARIDANVPDMGLLAQNFQNLTEQQREQMETLREQAREQADKVREMNRDAMRYAIQTNPKGVRIWQRCNDRDANRLYDCGQSALDDKQWDRAIDYFGKVAAAKGDRADAALYWKAYAQNKLGQRAEALNTIAEFKSGYARSHWSNDVSALEIDVRQHSGQPVKPGDTSDDDLKLLALQALMNNNSADAVPMLEKILQGPQSPRVKDRALFVLAQTQTPAARAIVVKVAKGGANPDLQARAVRYLGEINTPESRQALSEVYSSTTDPNVKHNVLRSYMQSNDREHLLAAARGEQDAELRGEAIRQLGNMRADDALAELYGRETSADVKKQIIRSLGNSGNADKLMALAQTEQDPELRRSAIRALGQMRRADTGPKLTAMYAKESSADVRKAVIDALFIQNNAAALVDLARKEKDGDLKLEVVKKLSVMKAPEAQNYLMELLK